MARTRLRCLRTAHAGQSPWERYLGAPGKAPHAHRRDRQVPSAPGSVLDAGGHGCTVTPSVRMSSRVMFAASTSRRRHQQAATMSSSGP
eukprot:7140256-Alexandrium_andersonii.AAC.1